MMPFTKGLFTVDPNATPEQLKRKRDTIQGIVGNLGNARYTGQGLAQLAQGIMAGIQNRKMNKIESGNVANATNMFNSMFAGGGIGGMGGSGGYGGGSPFVAPPPKSQWSQGTEVSPEEVAAIDRISRPDWNGGTMTPDMFNTFGQGGSAGAGGYSMGEVAAPSYGHPVADEFAATLAAGGLPQHVIDGIMMNAKDESAFNPTAIGDGGNAFGLLQWNGPRMRALKEWAASQGLDPAAPSTQAKFTLYELQGPEAAAGRALLSTSTPGEAGAVFVNQFERPAEQHRASREAAYLSGGGFTGGGAGGPNSAPVNPAMFGNIDEGQPAALPAFVAGGGQGAIPPGFDLMMQGFTGPNTAEIMRALSNPWLTPEQRSVLALQLEQAQKTSDPMYLMQLQEQQLRLKQMQGGGQGMRPMTASEMAQWGISPDSGSWGIGPDGKPVQIAEPPKSDQPSPTDDMREYELAVSQGFEGTFADYMTAMKRAGAPSTTIDNKGESEFDKALGKSNAEAFQGYQTTAGEALSGIATLDAMEASLNDPNFYSGTGAGAVEAIKRAAAVVGIANPDAATSMESFGALAKGAALTAMGGSLGAGFSNADRDFVEKQVPTISNTPEGNRQIIRIQKAILARKAKIAELAQEHRDRNGGYFDQGKFNKELQEWAAKNPLFAEAAAATGQGGGKTEFVYNAETGELE